MTRCLILPILITLLIWADARACMREQLDDRAIQWASLIVEAKLTKIDDAQPLPTTQPGSAVKEVLYHFQVQSMFDGIGVAGDEIRVVRFLGEPTAAGTPCAISLDKSSVGKSMILTLRKADQVTLPKNASIENAKEMFVLVHLADAKDYDANGRADLKRQIGEVRKSESAVDDKQIAQQVHAAAFAEDDTEANEAEEAIKQMGPKAIPELQKVMPDAPPAGKTRLKRLTEELTPPMVAAESETP